MSVNRQHLIDPEICIRCDTCEQTCPVNAISHDSNNYVVDPEKCNFCMDCISPCPTGSIDNWRMVSMKYTVDEQYSWEELPEQAEHDDEDEQQTQQGDVEANEILDVAHSGQGGKVIPPHSASHPYLNVYTRNNPAKAVVMGNLRITGDNTESDIRHIVLDFGKTAYPILEGQSIGIIPPGTDENNKPHRMRLYSVASPRDGERQNHNNLSLTVKRVIYEENSEKKLGVGSNYVCDLKKGDEVNVTGPYGSTFLMPNHPEANIIMICTGTGSAPFRAMTARRRRKFPNATSKLLLFFGARTKEELPYFGPLMKLPDSFIDKELVFSREADKPKEYVQDRMLTRSADISKLLQDEDTYVYICGLKGMEEGVADAFSKICSEHNMDWDSVREQMTTTGRYHVETY